MELYKYLITLTVIINDVSSTTTTESLPIVDLGYSVHQATFNSSANIYNFSNLHFATAPLFSKSLPISTTNRTINTGQTPGICPQSTPWWEIGSAQLSTDNRTSLQQINETYTAIQEMYVAGNTTLESELQSLLEFDPRTVQECLTLDVVVPQGIWEEKNTTQAPVIVWIFGGGYVSGDKNSAGNPSTLVAQSVNSNDSSSGVIFVSINYRLGLFGWLSGPKFQSEGGTSNLGLYDQRAAIEWVQENIHLFGGDPDRITVMGESAGGASIMHHLTAYGGTRKTSPFQQVIIQSPAFAPYPGPDVQDENYLLVLKWASILNSTQVTTLDELRDLPFEILLKVNELSTAPAYWGSMTWAPAVDGIYIPEPAGLLLKQGLFDHSVQVMTGHNSNEGAIFGSPLITTEAAYLDYLSQLIPNAANNVIGFVNGALYPPVFNGSQLYENEADREISTITDAAFICNARYIDLAYAGLGARGYYFDVSPGYHAQDLVYTFFNDGGTVSGSYEVNITLARQMQRLFTNFAQTGNPDGPGLPSLPWYGESSSLLSIAKGIPVLDSAATPQCDWWQEAYYYPRRRK